MNGNPLLSDYPRLVRSLRHKDITRKVLDRSTTVRSLLLFFIALICNAVFMGYFMLQSRRLHTSNIGALDFFNKFSEGGSQVRMNQAAVLNTVV